MRNWGLKEPPDNQCDDLSGWVFLAFRVIGVFGGVVLLIWLLSVTAGWPHAHDRHDLDTWFSRLMDQKGKSCCNGSDDRPLEAVWTTEGADGKPRYRVRIEGQWIDVPDTAVIDKPNKYGPALVWYYRSGSTFVIRCFLPGTLS